MRARDSQETVKRHLGARRYARLRPVAERSSETQKAAVFEAMEGMLVACPGNKLVRFAHNWNDGILEKWNNGFWLPLRPVSL